MRGKWSGNAKYLQKADIKKAPALHSGENSKYKQGLNKNCKSNSQPFQNRIHKTLCVTASCAYEAN